MNRRDFSKAILLGGSSLLLAGRTTSAAQQPLKLAVVSRTIDVNGRAATVFGLTGPDDRPGLTLAASVICTTPVLIIFLIFSRHIIRGMAMTGLKE